MELREINVTPHIAQNTTRRSAIDGRTTRHPGYAVSQRIRKRIEEGFGWMKTIAGFRKTKYRGLEKVRWAFTLAAAAYNLIRLTEVDGCSMNRNATRPMLRRNPTQASRPQTIQAEKTGYFFNSLLGGSSV